MEAYVLVQKTVCCGHRSSDGRIGLYYTRPSDATTGEFAVPTTPAATLRRIDVGKNARRLVARSRDLSTALDRLSSNLVGLFDRLSLCRAT